MMAMLPMLRANPLFQKRSLVRAAASGPATYLDQYSAAPAHCSEAICAAQVHNALRKQRRQLEKEAASFTRQAERLDGEAGFDRLRRCRIQSLRPASILQR